MRVQLGEALVIEVHSPSVCARRPAHVSCSAVKVGIVVPYSWSFWGAVIEHAELQARRCGKLGIETRTIMGNDPPGSFTRVLHPRLGRHGDPPPDVIPVGRSVIVPANGSLPNIVLSPSAVPRIRRVLERERFDVLHLHEPMTPAICVARSRSPAARSSPRGTPPGELGWMKVGMPLWGFLMDRIDYRIAVSEPARATIAGLDPGRVGDRPERRADPGRGRSGRRASTASSSSAATSRARGCTCCCAPGRISARAPARALRIIGADPLAVRLLVSRVGTRRRRRSRCSASSRRTSSPRAARARRRWLRPRWAARASAWCSRARSPARRPWSPPTSAATVTSSSPGRPSSFRRATPAALADAVVDAARRRGRGAVTLGAAARALARQERYSWERIADRLAEIYEHGRSARDGAARCGSPWLRVARASSRSPRSSACCSGGAGPTGTLVADAFQAVEWEWVAAAVGLNLLSIVARASPGRS